MESFADEIDVESDQMSEYSEVNNDPEDIVSCEDSESLCEQTMGPRPLSNRGVRTIYLITYSKVDVQKLATRDEFAKTVLEAFADTRAGKSEVVQWVCSQENHSSGDIHYHMAVKLSHPRRWLRVRNYLDERFGVQVNFSGHHSNYYSAWKYTTKEDNNYIQSENHPELENCGPPQTLRASQSLVSNEARQESRQKKRKRARLSIYDVSQLVVARGIKSRLELLALACQQKKDGKEDLAEFIANRGNKVVDEAINVGWEMEQAEEKLKRQKMSRIEILETALETDCVDNCNGQWIELAQDIIRRNNLTGRQFQTAVRDLLDKGRGKYRNILVKGSANCGKTFLLNPLNVVYNTFCNPASSSFAWVGAESCEVIFLNDFRWSPQILPWHDMLLLLEGQTVHLPAPKCHFAKDLVLDADTPIFCTGKHEIIFIKAGCTDEKENEMMRVRWRIFNFYSQIPESEQRTVPPCPRCFAKFILSGSDSNC